MKILIYSDNQWVIESIEKYIDFDYELLENIELKSLNQRIDYIFVDMQVKNNGGPSIIRELKRHKMKFKLVCNSKSIIGQDVLKN